jgi:nucleoside-diphosphate-sugar epimerase
MKVLVTGGTGFVGRHLVRALIEKGSFVRMLVRKTSNIEEFKDIDIELIQGEITNRNSLHGIARDIDIVYHLAAMGHVSAISKTAYQKFFEVNVNGTQNLAEECCHEQVGKFIHFSSTAAMGLIKKPLVDETVACQPSTPYQRSKYESEEIVKRYFKERGLAGLILRPCMIYGVGGGGEFLKWGRLIKKGFFPKIGRGRNLTPLVHVKDVVQAAVKAGDKGKPGGTYLITSSQSFELDEIRGLIAKHLGVDKPYMYVSYHVAKIGAYWLEMLAKLFKFTPVVTSRNIESTVTERVFSISKATDELGYVPKVDLEYGIEETITWYKDNGYL